MRCWGTWWSFFFVKRTCTLHIILTVQINRHLNVNWRDWMKFNENYISNTNSPCNCNVITANKSFDDSSLNCKTARKSVNGTFRPEASSIVTKRTIPGPLQKPHKCFLMLLHRLSTNPEISQLSVFEPFSSVFPTGKTHFEFAVFPVAWGPWP